MKVIFTVLLMLFILALADTFLTLRMVGLENPTQRTPVDGIVR